MSTKNISGIGIMEASRLGRDFKKAFIGWLVLFGILVMFGWLIRGAEWRQAQDKIDAEVASSLQVSYFKYQFIVNLDRSLANENSTYRQISGLIERYVSDAYSRVYDNPNPKLIDDFVPRQFWTMENAFMLAMQAAFLQGYGNLHCKTAGGQLLFCAAIFIDACMAYFIVLTLASCYYQILISINKTILKWHQIPADENAFRQIFRRNCILFLQSIGIFCGALIGGTLAIKSVQSNFALMDAFIFTYAAMTTIGRTPNLPPIIANNELTWFYCIFLFALLTVLISTTAVVIVAGIRLVKFFFSAKFIPLSEPQYRELIERARLRKHANDANFNKPIYYH